MKDLHQKQDWFTASELAEIAKDRGLTNFPNTKRGVTNVAARLGWNEECQLARKRPGRAGGGGMEYHYSLLPEKLQAVIAARDAKATIARQLTTTLIEEDRQLAALKEQAQPKQAIGAREARAEITRSIEVFAAMEGESRAWALKAFLDAQEAHFVRAQAAERLANGNPISPKETRLIQQRDPLEEKFGITVETIEKANARPRGSQKISRATLYRWFKERETGGVGSLAPAPSKHSAPIPPGFDGFLRFYAIGSKPDATEALKDYLATDPPEHLRITIDQVRYVLKHKLNDIERNVGREGLLTLRSRMAYVERSTEKMLPTTMYTADGKTFDAEIADPVSLRPMRPELTSIIDVATRRCVGIAISRKENVIAVTEALRKSCEHHGIPAIFYVDRGAGYKNKTFDTDESGLMARLSITKMHALPYNSQAKGIVERFNKTVWNPLAKKFPTYIGADMDKEAGQLAHKKTRADIKEFGHSRLLMGWDDFRKACERAVEDYNRTPHSGLPKFEDPETGRIRHMTPLEAWEAHVRNGFKPVMPDADEIDDLFRPYETRIVRRALVNWNRNTFFHEKLEAYHGEKVLVGYDDDQADRVWVRERLENGEPGRLICIAIFGGNRTDYVPLTAQKKAEENRLKGRLKRLDNKRRDIEAEAEPPMLTQSSSEIVAEFRSDPIEQPTEVETSKVIAHPRRKGFSNDLDLAEWALDHPREVTTTQLRILKECMSRPSTVDYFRMSGVDLDALAELLRGAA